MSRRRVIIAVVLSAVLVLCLGTLDQMIGIFAETMQAEFVAPIDRKILDEHKIVKTQLQELMPKIAKQTFYNRPQPDADFEEYVGHLLGWLPPTYRRNDVAEHEGFLRLTRAQYELGRTQKTFKRKLTPMRIKH